MGEERSFFALDDDAGGRTNKAKEEEERLLKAGKICRFYCRGSGGGGGDVDGSRICVTATTTALDVFCA